MKAKFEITIIHPSDYTAISNTQAKKNKDEKKTQKDEIKTTQFEETPKMSTYLVAFVISKYKYKSNDDDTSTVWTRPDVIDSASFALEHGDQVLDDLGKFTEIKYYSGKKKELTMGMKKMDQISIPQFRAGAMENWGLVTYR